MATHDHILREMIRRQEQLKKVKSSPVFPLKKFCFDKQLKFITDTARFKCAVTSRRAGKTNSCSADLLHTATTIPRSNSLYLTLNRASAKKIIWSDLLELNSRYKLEGEPNISELTLTFPNGSIIYIGGAGDMGQIEKFRGMKLHKIYIDESQAFGPYFDQLIDEILVPCIWDTNGSIILIGTPNAACSGPLFDASHGVGQYKGWSSHHWTIHDNPHIKKTSGKHPQQILDEELKRKGITADHPSFQREGLGRWIKSNETLVYKYSLEINHFDKLPSNQRWNYVMGVDLGWTSANAIVIWGFTEDDPHLYLIEEWREAKQHVHQLADKIKYFEKKYVEFNKKVIDTGGAGKAIADELAQRHGVRLQPAEKTKKMEYIELMNDDLRTGKILIPQNSLLAQEMSLLQWDTNSRKPMEDRRYSNHLCDAALYAFREAKHFLYVAPTVKSQIGSEQYYQEEAEFMKNKIIEEQNRVGKNSNKEWWEEGSPENSDEDDFFR